MWQYIACAAGAYTAENGNEALMLIVRDIGGGAYYFDLLSLDEEFDMGTARKQPDGAYLIDADDGRVLMRLEEGVYVLDMFEDDALGLIAGEGNGENLKVSLS